MKKIICLILLFLSICLFVPPVSCAEDEGVKTKSSSVENEKRVILKVHVLKDGAVGEVLVQESSGDQLIDNEAIKVVKECHFIPLKDSNGEPRECFVRVPVTFRQKD